jgi:hypothetical protein
MSSLSRQARTSSRAVGSRRRARPGREIDASWLSRGTNAPWHGAFRPFGSHLLRAITSRVVLVCRAAMVPSRKSATLGDIGPWFFESDVVSLRERARNERLVAGR